MKILINKELNLLVHPTDSGDFIVYGGGLSFFLPFISLSVKAAEDAFERSAETLTHIGISEVSLGGPEDLPEGETIYKMMADGRLTETTVAELLEL